MKNIPTNINFCRDFFVFIAEANAIINSNSGVFFVIFCLPETRFPVVQDRL